MSGFHKVSAAVYEKGQEANKKSKLDNKRKVQQDTGGISKSCIKMASQTETKADEKYEHNQNMDLVSAC